MWFVLLMVFGLHIPEVITALGIIVGFIGTVVGIYYSQRTKPVEQAQLDLERIVAAREALDARVEHLEGLVDTLEQEREEFKGKAGNFEKEIMQKTSEVQQLQGTLAALQRDFAEQKRKVQALQDHLLESRMMVSILTEQRNQMARSFGIPMSISDMVRTGEE
jgi:predicted RNase H-like nuclease (RuvC/YqgF family)